jgi:hypothetical protein
MVSLVKMDWENSAVELLEEISSGNNKLVSQKHFRDFDYS